jgi:hypothetical protein
VGFDPLRTAQIRQRIKLRPDPGAGNRVEPPLHTQESPIARQVALRSGFGKASSTAERELGNYPYPSSSSLAQKDLRFFADRAAKKWPLRGSLKLGVGCL